MAKTNKYTSINFNHIYEKNLPANSTSPNSNPKLKTPSSSSSSSSTSFSYSVISSATNKTHGGRMFVLTRPAPKPISIPQPQPQPQPEPQPQAPVGDPVRSEPGSDAISLRPLGTTGGGSPLFSQEREKDAPVVIAAPPPPKPDKFVPPHLRPGFVGREERPGPEVMRAQEMRQRHLGSPGRYGEEGRPKSGGGHERMRRGGDHSDLAMMNPPRSSGNRPSSS